MKRKPTLAGQIRTALDGKPDGLTEEELLPVCPKAGSMQLLRGALRSTRDNGFTRRLENGRWAATDKKLEKHPWRKYGEERLAQQRQQ